MLIDKLKAAIAKEPNNVSLYIVLGSVYDNLYQKMDASGDNLKGEEYFNAALDYYNQAIEKDPRNIDAAYSLGSLYYNKAALVSQKTANTSEAEQEMMMLFEQALSHFQKAESLDANDINTLTALKEIYSRKKDNLAAEFQKRLEVVQKGGKNRASYFN